MIKFSPEELVIAANKHVDKALYKAHVKDANFKQFLKTLIFMLRQTGEGNDPAVVNYFGHVLGTVNSKGEHTTMEIQVQFKAIPTLKPDKKDIN